MSFLGMLGEMSVHHKGEEVEVEWKIPNLDSLSQEADACYQSPNCFSCEGELWYLEIWPNGRKSTDSLGYISLCLWRWHDTGFLVRKSYSLALKTINGQKTSERHGAAIFDACKEHSVDRFLSRYEFERRKSEYLVSGFITVVCTLKPFDAVEEFERLRKEYEDAQLILKQTVKENDDIKKKVDAYKSDNEMLLKEKLDLTTDLKATKRGVIDASTAEISINKADKSEIVEANESKRSGSNEKSVIETKKSVSPENYGVVADINYLFEERKGVGVTFVLQTSGGDIEIFAHQLILAIRSSFFGEEFYSKDGDEGHKIVPLKGIDPEAFRKMIRYCYDYKPGLKTTEEACALLRVAFDFRVVGLVKLCCTFLKSTKIEPANVFSVLKVAEEIEDNSLEDMCLKVLQDKTGDIMTSYELHDVTPSMVHTILKLSKLSLNSEYELIMWILNWAKLKSEDKYLNCKSTREYLGSLVREMNFLSLTGPEFGKLCKEHRGFFTSDEIASISMNIMVPGTMEMPEWHNKDLKLRVYSGSKQ